MKIIATADLHGQLPPPCEPCDLLIIAGDICPDNRPIVRQGEWLERVFIPWLKAQPAVKIVGIWGNHDFIGLPKYAANRPELSGYIEMLTDETTVVNGLMIYGYPWTPGPPTMPKWAFMHVGDTPMTLVGEIPHNLDILISHGPPYGYHDVAPTPNDDGDFHVGSKNLLLWCREITPKHLVCGHLHGGRGSSQADWGGMVWNVASVDDRYNPYPERYMEITID